MAQDWTYEELVELTNAQKSVNCSFSKALDIVSSYSDSALNELEFSLEGGWRSRPEAVQAMTEIKAQLDGNPVVFRLLSRIKRSGSVPFDVVLAKELGAVTSYPSNIERVYGKKRQQESYEHLIATIRFEDGSIAQVEISYGDDLTEVYEIEASGANGIVFYRNEPLAPFQVENRAQPIYKVDEGTQKYRFVELKKTSDVMASINGSIHTKQPEVIR